MQIIAKSAMRDFVAADLEDMNRWYTLRGLPPIPLAMLSPTGLIVPSVAAMWLYKTDSNLAILDCLITNPEAPLRERSDAVKCLSRGLLDAAHGAGYKAVVAWCASHGVSRIAQTLGFQPGGSYALVKRRF